MNVFPLSEVAETVQPPAGVPGVAVTLLAGIDASTARSAVIPQFVYEPALSVAHVSIEVCNVRAFVFA